MTDILDITDLGVDLPLPRGLLGAILPNPRPTLNLIDQINLSLAQGETLGIVGESGSGKTTLARAVMGLVPMSRGHVAVMGHSMSSAADFSEMRRKSAMMFQDAGGSLSPRMTVGMLITEPFRIQRFPLPDPRIKAAELLASVGLPNTIAARYPHELSGGQARRVSVARALALNPQLVIADEPTAGLDVSIQGEVLNLLADLKADMGLSLMIITHNLAMVRHVADRLAILYLGRVMESGPTDRIFASPAHPYTASLIASEPQPDPRKRRADLAIKGEIPSLLKRPSGCVFHTRCTKASAICRDEVPLFREMSKGWRVACHTPNLPEPQHRRSEHELEH